MIQDSLPPALLDAEPTPSAAGPNGVDGLALYRNMRTIQALERAFEGLAKDGFSRGSLHLSEGQEAIPAGACAALRQDDYLTMTYRGHGYAVCKGTSLDRIVAEVCGRTDGLCKGKGGKMHLTDPEFGLLGANGIVAGGIPTAVGAALATKMDGGDKVSLTVFGDATINQGAAHEAMNLAAVWNLPVIFLCENNGYGEMTPFDVTSPTGYVGDRMAAYGIEAVSVDGNDPLAVYETVARAVAKARGGGGPTFVEAMTYRTCGHYNGDPGGYRPESEVEEWRAKGPLVRFERHLLENGFSQEDLDRAGREAEEAVAHAREFALNSPAPTPEALTEDLYVESAPVAASEAGGRTRNMTFVAALNEALVEEFERDPDVFLMGEDVGQYGGIFRVTQGLQGKFGPERVRDTPISEAGFVGAALGAAITGKRPIVEILFADFSFVAMDQILNQVAKARYMSGGGITVPVVLRMQGGGYKGQAAQHSQSIEAMFAHIPGLLVVAPSTAEDAKGMLKSAIRDDNPVVFLEHKMIYTQSSPVPEGEYTTPLDKAVVRREGGDVTLLGYSYAMGYVNEAADVLAKEGISCEVIDLRSIHPLDMATIGESIRKTHRCVVVHEAHTTLGLGAEIAARVQEHLFDELDAPVLRVGGADVPVPYALELESAMLPSVDRICATVRASLNR